MTHTSCHTWEWVIWLITCSPSYVSHDSFPWLILMCDIVYCFFNTVRARNSSYAQDGVEELWHMSHDLFSWVTFFFFQTQSEAGIVDMLKRYRSSGRKVFLVTNSLWYVTWYTVTWLGDICDMNGSHRDTVLSHEFADML